MEEDQTHTTEEKTEEEVKTEAPVEVTSVEQKRLPSVSQLLVALGLLLIIFGISYIPGFRKDDNPQTTTKQSENFSEQSAQTVNYFEDVELEAAAAYVWDVREGRALYNKNAGAQLPLASLTKLMTALVVHETLEGAQPVHITLEAIHQEGESYFTAGEAFTANALTDLTLLTSSNDGAYALAAAAGNALADNDEHATSAFVDQMNKRAEEIGLSQTYFTNPTGLDTNESRSGSYGSARDMAFLMEYLISKKSSVLEATALSSQVVADNFGTTFTATNTNGVTQQIPNLIGSKTGYTDLAGGNLVIAFDAGLNRPIIVSVIGSSREGRFSDALKLTESARKTILSE